MAQVKNNQVTKGVSGKFGEDIVFRQFGKRTIFGARPRKATTISERMKAHRERFKKATKYAKAKMSDPAAKAEYEALAKQREIASAFAAAVGDFLKAPEISSLTADGYSGGIGSIVSIEAVDNFKITAITISISQADGTVLETGDATLAPGDTDWKFVTTVNNPTLAGTKVTAKAFDRAGNEAIKELTL
jgi:hypothetical protein